jgi:hypothetical protein
MISRRCRLRNPSKRFFAIDLSATSAREITDALVIFSTVFLTYEGIANWGGLLILQKIVGPQVETPSFLYFFGAALVVFSVRRIVDQRHERMKRVAAEQHVTMVSTHVIVPTRATSSHGLATTNSHFVWQGRILKPRIELRAHSLKVSKSRFKSG